MKYLQFILLLTIILQSCKDTGTVNPTPVTPPEPTPTTDAFNYLALGDSYTIGESVAQPERYPIQLRDRLMPNTIENIEVKITARTGWTTDELQNGINATTDFKPKYDLVSLLIGVNNQYRGYPLEEYKVEFRALLEQAIQFAGNDTGRVFVVSIPDYAFTPFGSGNTTTSQEIDDFNAANKSITDEYGVQYFDITPISREGLDRPSLVATDGLHPSGEQYKEWVDLMESRVRKMVE